MKIFKEKERIAYKISEQRIDKIRKKLESNPIIECNKIQNRFCPELFSMFGKVKDPRHQSYVDYSARVMLGTMYYKSIAGISSMQEMTRAFNDERICRNLYRFMGEDAKEYLPHGVTENEFLERLEPTATNRNRRYKYGTA